MAKNKTKNITTQKAETSFWLCAFSHTCLYAMAGWLNDRRGQHAITCSKGNTYNSTILWMEIFIPTIGIRTTSHQMSGCQLEAIINCEWITIAQRFVNIHECTKLSTQQQTTTQKRSPIRQLYANIICSRWNLWSHVVVQIYAYIEKALCMHRKWWAKRIAACDFYSTELTYLMWCFCRWLMRFKLHVKDSMCVLCAVCMTVAAVPAQSS